MFIKNKGLAAKSPQSCPTLCDPIESSPPGSPIPGILQARTPEWVAISQSLDITKCFFKALYLLGGYYLDSSYSDLYQLS